ncbi:MAG: AAA family ATPase [Thaumarchaeota archaeon]|nr:AAA family ATPase [Nitrososphaerota archaeon]
MRIVAITGMPGAGKSTAAKALVSKGWRRVVMGDVIREETKKRGLKPDAKNTGEVMKALRKERGEAAVAELCMEHIRKSKSDRVVVDGIRSMAEVEVFRRSAKVLLVAVHASKDRRYVLLRERGRRDDPLSIEMFQTRDERELQVGVGRPISLADQVVLNEYATTQSLSDQIVEAVEKWVSLDAP